MCKSSVYNCVCKSSVYNCVCVCKSSVYNCVCVFIRTSSVYNWLLTHMQIVTMYMQRVSAVTQDGKPFKSS